MGNLKLKGKDILDIGYPNNHTINIALDVMKKNFAQKEKQKALQLLKDILNDPSQFSKDLTFGQIAESLKSLVKVEKSVLRTQRMPYQIFGSQISEEAKSQLYTSLKLPVSVKGALMPDAHSGYGLPIGGVLAVNNAIIPYAVGMDIGCRMRLSILDLPVNYMNGAMDKLKNVLIENTKFGMTEVHKSHIDYEVLDSDIFNQIPLLRRLKDKAAKQMGTSGGGNHFVEFGEVDIKVYNPQIDLPVGTYLGILSHSGSRGLGAEIAQYYSRVAVAQCPLPKEAQHLAWLELDSHLGLEYWMSMQLAGDYASACHADIHRRLVKAIGGRVRAKIENHHNFAWMEMHDGQEVIVHRKGATPAADGELGLIPGSMTAKGYIVSGKGNEASLHSASHGAGRACSRFEARNSFTQSEIRKALKQKSVVLIGGSIEEAPMAYKDIQTVMNEQQELVDILGTFQPRIVRMAE